MIIKVRYTQGGKPRGRAYTFSAEETVKVGDEMELPSGGKGIAVEVLPDKTPQDYTYPIKTAKKAQKESEEKKDD